MVCTHVEDTRSKISLQKKHFIFAKLEKLSVPTTLECLGGYSDWWSLNIGVNHSQNFLNWEKPSLRKLIWCVIWFKKNKNLVHIKFMTSSVVLSTLSEENCVLQLLHWCWWYGNGDSVVEMDQLALWPLFRLTSLPVLSDLQCQQRSGPWFWLVMTLRNCRCRGCQRLVMWITMKCSCCSMTWRCFPQWLWGVEWESVFYHRSHLDVFTRSWCPPLVAPIREPSSLRAEQVSKHVTARALK